MSESENPAIDAPEPQPAGRTPTRTGGPTSSTCSAPPALARGNPLGADFDYAAKFAELDVDALKQDSSRC